MSDQSGGEFSERDNRVREVISTYLAALGAGTATDPESLVALHPDLAEELCAFLLGRASSGEAADLTTGRDSGSSHLDGSATELLGPGATREGSSPTTDAHESTESTASAGGKYEAVGTGTHVRNFGDYELLGLLGKGGMGVVYKARQLSLNRLVAIKMLQSKMLPSEDELRRFQIEAEAVAMLDHPHIVPILEIGEVQDQRYFSMKLIDGSSLDHRLNEFRSDPTAAAGLVVTIAAAVQHAHDRAVLHRDLKPANVLLDEQGEAFVTDFGLARRLEVDSELTQSGAIVGTPAYMAPEQASGKRREITKATDVYGLGAILYALLTGRAPFQAESIAEVLQAVRDQAPEAPSKINRLVPRDLEVICLKCLEKDPARRYGRADALAEDLKRWLAGKPIEARPAGPVERGWRWCRRNPATVGFSATIIVLLAALAGLAVILRGWVGGQKTDDSGASVRLAQPVNPSASAVPQRGRVDVRIPDEDTVAYLSSLSDETTLVGSGIHEISRPAGRYALNGIRGGSTLTKALYVTADKKLEVEATPTGKAKPAHRAELLTRFYQPQLRLQTGGHSAPVRVMVFSSEGSHLYSAGEDKVINYWNLHDPLPRLERTLRPPVWRGPTGIIYAMAVAHTSDAQGQSLLAVAGYGIDSRRGNINVFRVPGLVGTPTGEVAARMLSATDGQPQAIGHRNTVLCLAFDPSGQVLGSGSMDKTVILWDVAKAFSPRAVLRGHTGDIRALAFSPDSKRLATTGSDGTLRLWDVQEGTQIAKLEGHTQNPVAINTLAFSRDGATIVVGRENGDLYRFDARNIAEVQPVKLPTLAKQGPVLFVTYSPDGLKLAVSLKSDAGPVPDPMSICCDIEVRAMPDGKIVRRWRGVQGLVRALVFSPGGDRLAYSGGSAQAVIIQEMSKPGKPPVEAKGDGSTLFDVGFSADSQVVGFTRERFSPADPPRSYDGFDMRQHRSRNVARDSLHRAITAYRGWTLRPSLEPFGLEAIHPDGRVRRFDIDPATERMWWSSTFVPPGPGHPSATVAVGTESGVAIFELETGQRTRVFAGHTGPAVSLASSPDGRWLASSSFDQVIMFYPLAGCDKRPALGATFRQRPDHSWVVDRVERSSFADAMGLQRGDLVAEAGIGRQGQTKAQYYRKPDEIAGFIAAVDGEPPGTSSIGIKALRTVWMPILSSAQVTMTLPTTKRDNQVLTLFQGVDKEWVLWTRQGYYHSSIIADQKYLGWHRNGDARNPSTEFFPAVTFEAQFRRPDLLAGLWAADDPVRYEASLELVTPRNDPEPHRLMVLAIGQGGSTGVSLAPMDFAGRDAKDLASLFIELGRRFGFDQITARCLAGPEVTSERIGEAIADLQAEGSVRRPRPGDAIVVFLETHLHEVEGELRLLGSDSSLDASFAPSVAASEVGDQLKGLAERGYQVLAFLDLRKPLDSDRLDGLLTEWERALFLAGVAVFVGPKDGAGLLLDDTSQRAFAACLLNALKKALPAGPEPNSAPPRTVELFAKSLENEMRTLTSGRQQPNAYFTDTVARTPLLDPRSRERQYVASPRTEK
jgi:serine/threonine protein kinase/WD40 repeat protein